MDTETKPSLEDSPGVFLIKGLLSSTTTSQPLSLKNFSWHWYNRQRRKERGGNERMRGSQKRKGRCVLAIKVQKK